MTMKTNDNGVEREMTAQEQAAHEAWQAIAAKEAQELAKTEKARTTARASALAKLAALGLSDDEIAALVG